MKMLKSKNIRRICVLLAMVAPAVYLFGSLFSGLTGAHGTEVFAEPVYVQQYVEVDSYVDDGSSYKLVVDDDVLAKDFLRSLSGTWSTVNCSYVWNDYDCTYFRYGLYTPYNSRTFSTSVSDLARYVVTDDRYVFDRPIPWTFTFSSGMDLLTSLFNGYSKLYVLASVPSSEVPENAGAYSDYVFKNFFAKDNFLEQIGKDVLSDNPHGFVPFASFWKYLDNNMLHMGDMQLGLMGYGYVYYCCHVLLFDIAFILVTFFLDFIQKVNDKVVGGVD